MLDVINGYKKCIAIIPARGNSKGVPRKNVRMFNGKPLICWAIESALNSRIIDEVYVNSEDEGILNLAKNYDKVQIFKRPEHFATDNSKIFDTLKHFNKHIKADILVQLNCTNIRTGHFIDNVLSQYRYHNYDMLCTGFMSNHFETGSINMQNRQQLNKFFYDDANIYAFNSNYIKNNAEFYPPKELIQTVITDEIYNYEIDTQIDFEILEFLHKKYILNRGDTKC